MEKKVRRTPRMETRLAPQDFIEFDQICRMEGKTRSEMVRKAIQFYVANHERLRKEPEESALDKRLKKMEDRIAGLLVKLGIGVYKLDHLFWIRSDSSVRKELFKECYVAGVRRMREKLNKDEEELRQATGKQ
jgi:hypothetical protein